MPRAIKKKAARKKPVKEDEVKSTALQAIHALKERRKHIIVGVSVIAGITLVLIILSFYSTSQYKTARALEKESMNYYFGENIETMSDEDRYKKALALLKESVEMKVTPTALYYLGNTYFRLGEYENAIEEYRRFISRYSNDTFIIPLVYQKLASSYFKTNQNERALETLDQLSSINNGIFNDTALMMKARHYEASGQTQKATETFREITTAHPLSPWSSEAASKLSADDTVESEKPSERRGEDAGESQERE